MSPSLLRISASPVGSGESSLVADGMVAASYQPSCHASDDASLTSRASMTRSPAALSDYSSACPTACQGEDQEHGVEA